MQPRNGLHRLIATALATGALAGAASCSSFADAGDSDASSGDAADDRENHASDAASVDAADARSTGDADPRRLVVFVTKITTNGQFGGANGGLEAYAWAKEACSRDAALRGLGRKVEPGICTGVAVGEPVPSVNLIDRLPRDARWFLPSGAGPAVEVAAGLRFLLPVNERVDEITLKTRVWTGCDATGLRAATADRDCSGWSSASDAGDVGQAGETDWTSDPKHGLEVSTDPCHAARPIYCFEVP